LYPSGIGVLSRSFGKTSILVIEMLDILIFGISGTFVLCILFMRFQYQKNLTGLSNAGSVGAGYWGNYSSSRPEAGPSIKLPHAIGICPRCVSKSNGGMNCSEH
jgi:hypothetical protein